MHLATLRKVVESIFNLYKDCTRKEYVNERFSGDPRDCKKAKEGPEGV